MFNVAQLTFLAPVYAVAVLGGVLAGSVSPPLAYSRTVTFGITLMHSILAGALVGVFLKDVTGVSVSPALTAIALASAVSLLTAEAVSSGFPEDAAVALSVGVSVSIAVIMAFEVSIRTSYGMSEAMGYVFGTAALATWVDVARLAASLILVLPLTHMFWYEYKYLAFDPEGARAMGIHARVYRYLYFFTVAVAASILAMSLGVLLAHIIISLPGLMALRLRTSHPFRLSYGVCVSMLVSGYCIAWLLGWPPSGGVGLVAAVLIALTMVVGRGG